MIGRKLDVLRRSFWTFFSKFHFFETVTNIDIMNKLLVLILFSFPYFLLAQSGTSADEYKYLTKGYVYQKEMGLDGKAGYAVKPLFTASNGLAFSGLFKDSNNDLKGVLLEMRRAEGKPHYICLPNNNSQNAIRGMYENDLKQKLSLAEKEAFDKALLEFAMNQVAGGKMTNQISQNKTNATFDEPVPSSYDTQVPLFAEDFGGDSDKDLVAKSVNSENLPIDKNVEALVKLEGRATLSSPVARGTHSKKGTVVIKVCVDADGLVKSAKFTQRGSNTFNKDLKQQALNATRSAKFSSSTKREQCGTVTFKFK